MTCLDLRFRVLDCVHEATIATACVDTRSRRCFRPSPQGVLRNSIYPALVAR